MARAAAGRKRPARAVAAAICTACALAGFAAGGVIAMSTAARHTADAATGRTSVWRGAVTPVAVTVADASCQGKSSNDAAGNRVTYEPAFAVDDDPESAWRCSGDGAGETLVLKLASQAQVAELGLVPGYAKTDPADGTDRYAENRRITAVRWRFDDGTAVDQHLDPDQTRRELQTVRLVPTAASQIVLEIVSSTDADRDTVAVSDLRVSAAAQ